MADISQITLPNGSTYDIKDASARASIPNKISTSEKGSANGVAELDSNGKVPSSQLPVMTGSTTTMAGSAGLVPAPSTTDVDLFLSGDGTWKSGGKPMVILSYGNSTWQDFINAYNSNIIVYCRASSNSNPASGSQTRMAFMAYVDNASSPTNVEFQYYRSVSSHSSSQQGDQVYVYKLTQSSGWSVTVREAMSKIAAGSNISLSYGSGTITLSGNYSAFTGATSSTAGAAGLVPAPPSGDESKFLQADGTWASPPTVTSITNAEIDTLFT